MPLERWLSLLIAADIAVAGVYWWFRARPAAAELRRCAESGQHGSEEFRVKFRRVAFTFAALMAPAAILSFLRAYILWPR